MFQLSMDKYFPSVFAHINTQREQCVRARAYVCLCILKIVSVRRFVANENKYGLFQGIYVRTEHIARIKGCILSLSDEQSLTLFW